MKLNIFYSLQSDLPNKTNRGFIGKCIGKSLKKIYLKNNSITEYVIESDSRNETGTPDLASNIFAKIDQCDIFISDISIINSNSDFRKSPNPNVLIELGYACSKIGWERVLCLFNSEYGKIEDLPFDIRFRKPLIYSLPADNSEKLTHLLEVEIQSIIDNHISNKKYYNMIKKEIDLGIQAILIDITKLLYFRETPKCYDYNLLLHMENESIKSELKNKKILGFQLFKNKEIDISEFSNYYNDQINTQFMNTKEKNILARIIIQLKELKKILNNLDIYNELELQKKYKLINASKMNKNNTTQKYILIEALKDNKGIVLDSGEFNNDSLNKLLHYFSVKENSLEYVSNTIYYLTTEINEWIRNTGGSFIINERMLSGENIRE